MDSGINCHTIKFSFTDYNQYNFFAGLETNCERLPFTIFHFSLYQFTVLKSEISREKRQIWSFKQKKLAIMDSVISQ